MESLCDKDELCLVTFGTRPFLGLLQAGDTVNDILGQAVEAEGHHLGTSCGLLTPTSPSSSEVASSSS
jgi:hypothetical protein